MNVWATFHIDNPRLDTLWIESFQVPCPFLKIGCLWFSDWFVVVLNPRLLWEECITHFPLSVASIFTILMASFNKHKFSVLISSTLSAFSVMVSALGFFRNAAYPRSCGKLLPSTPLCRSSHQETESVPPPPRGMLWLVLTKVRNVAVQLRRPAHPWSFAASAFAILLVRV